MTSKLTSTDLQSPLGQLASQLSDSDLRLTAYDVFLAVCRTSSSKPLSTSASFNSDSPSVKSPSSNHNNKHSTQTPALQRSLTSQIASKIKKTLGLKSPGSSSGSKNSPGSGPGQVQAACDFGGTYEIQMRIPESVDSRVRRALLRIGGCLVSSNFIKQIQESTKMPREMNKEK
ncbi:hypothetical protein COLO4_13885 [Corchorus olitorius]|uniref:Uncharacterized protein n=1 Tax=Corchorus olitorius TaxID=93759 RepID=A0A1R3JUG2_9ROSI|nr:hypothetical protein COLO4_13885 [Corchorus olitorius]